MIEIENAAAAGEAAPVKTVYRLKLDHDCVYWGAELVDAANINDGDVVLDHAPDNALGRYKWNAELRCFQALPTAQIKSAPEAPTLEQAFHDLVLSLEEAGHALPVVVRAWAEEFKRTLDEKTK